jgi:cell fate regulator YaaT (PSP1 superfamily)
MPIVVGVRFRPVAKTYSFDPGELEDLAVGDYVIVEPSRGQELGQIVLPPMEVPEESITSPLKKVVRRATAWDLVQREIFYERESTALARCAEKVAEMELPMKLVRAEYSFDGSRLAFLFTAEKRVDFRELVRDLARIFKTRIEMRQIGVRDEAKLLNGIGRCGRSLCCCSWLDEFHPVSIKMAKNQNLPLAPSEISGLCSRLLCCLSYENEYYCQVKKALPKVGDSIQTDQGKGRVTGLNLLKETAVVELEKSATEIEVTAHDINPATEQPARSRPARRRKKGKPKQQKSTTTQEDQDTT